MESPIGPYGAGSGSVSLVSRLSLVFFPQMFERPAELVPGAVDIRFDSSKRQIEGRRDFLVRSPLDVPEHDARSVLRPEAGDRLFDRCAHLAGLQLVQGRLLV